MAIVVEQLHKKWQSVLEKRKDWTLGDKYREFDNEHIFLFLIWPSLLSDILHIWFLESYRKKDPKIFMNALFTYNHLSFERGKVTQDQSWIPVVYALAGNDNNLIYKILWEYRMGTWFADVIYNTIYSLIHEEETQKRENRVKEIQRHIHQKNTQFDHFLLTYLLWYMLDDPIMVYTSMDGLIRNYKKCKWLLDFSSPIHKHFWLFLHGLYNLQMFLGRNYGWDDLFYECPFLWYELTQVDTPGKHFIDFQGELQFLKSY